MGGIKLLSLSCVLAASLFIAVTGAVPGVAPTSAQQAAGCVESGPALSPREGRGPGIALGAALAALQDDLAAHVFAAPRLEVRVVDEPQMQARAILGTPVIEVTSALEAHPWTADELYAILAHEAFHQVLHAGPRCGITPARMQAQELEADHQALDLMAKSGRDPRSLGRVLALFAKGDGSSNASDAPTHPEFSVRIDALAKHAIQADRSSH